MEIKTSAGEDVRYRVSMTLPTESTGTFEDIRHVRIALSEPPPTPRSSDQTDDHLRVLQGELGARAVRRDAALQLASRSSWSVGGVEKLGLDEQAAEVATQRLVVGHVSPRSATKSV